MSGLRVGRHDRLGERRMLDRVVLVNGACSQRQAGERCLKPRRGISPSVIALVEGRRRGWEARRQVELAFECDCDRFQLGQACPSGGEQMDAGSV